MTAMLSEQDKVALKLYCKTCDEILEARFVKDIPKQDHTIWSKMLPDGTYEGGVPVYDRDDFRSFMAVFRKLWLTNEPTNVYRILKILSRFSPDEEQRQLKIIRRNLQSMEKHGIAFDLGNEQAKNLYSPRDVCDVVLNADLFHSDLDKQRAFEKLQSFGSFFEVSLIKYVTAFCRQAIQVSEVVKHRRYFD